MIRLESEVTVFFNEHGGILSIEPLGYIESGREPLQRLFPFSEYNTPTEMGRSVVKELDNIANDLKTIVPDEMKLEILEAFDIHADFIEEMILLNKPATKLH